jgi:hypothetical protein
MPCHKQNVSASTGIRKSSYDTLFLAHRETSLYRPDVGGTTQQQMWYGSSIKEEKLKKLQSLHWTLKTRPGYGVLCMARL